MSKYPQYFFVDSICEYFCSGGLAGLLGALTGQGGRGGATERVRAPGGNRDENEEGARAEDKGRVDDGVDGVSLDVVQALRRRDVVGYEEKQV